MKYLPAPRQWIKAILGNLFRRRNLLVPTWKGTLVLAALFAIVTFSLVSEVHSFLAKTERVEADILVVEGWIPDYALKAAVKEYNKGGYRLLCTTGGPLDHGSHLSSYTSWAKLAGATLQILGVPEREILIAPSSSTRRYRTFYAAQALRRTFSENGIDVRAFNILTLSTHARRTQLVYRQVFGNDVEVGILSIKSLDYDPERWWTSSSGTKTVLIELIGWLVEASSPRQLSAKTKSN